MRANRTDFGGVEMRSAANTGSKILLIYIQLSFCAHLQVQTGDRCGSLKIAAHIERQTLLGAQLRSVRHEHGICKGGKFLLQFLKTFHAFIKHVCQLFFKKRGTAQSVPPKGWIMLSSFLISVMA